jgi:hypothetical protein
MFNYEFFVFERWALHVARMEERRGAYRILVGSLRERDHSENLCVDDRIMLKCILTWYGGRGVD